MGEWFEVSEKLADDGARSGQPYAQIEQFAFYVAKTGALQAQEDVPPCTCARGRSDGRILHRFWHRRPPIAKPAAASAAAG
ncbi:hypothetical protein [Gordoniibacillus kamchatkensis]|uniref:hypothetical protein n=1 Tax=Gordoniibacillus kamchatkensis TaxID=1590651 RepID=UPI0012DFFE5E|nr:hypothetical protein [Paenibacillus sp. VKM B-2647]